MELNICHLYPDILNLYGDRGNIITMKRRLESRGISVNVDECSIGQPLDVAEFDVHVDVVDARLQRFYGLS